MLTAIAATFAVVVALLLLAPIGLELQVGDPALTQATARIEARLTWAGLASVVVAPTAQPRSPRPGGRKRGSAAATLPRLMRLLRSQGLLAAVARLIARLLSATHPRDVRVRVALGFEDPAETGQLWAAVGPASAMLWSASAGAITVEPDFHEPRAAVHATGRFFIIPGQLVWIVLAFVLSPTVMRAAWTASRR